MTIFERLEALRRAMAQAELDAYLVPTADPHGSEYVAPHDQARAYLSGFTGSAGTLLVTATEGFLWTDSRYFLQAERELFGSGIRLMQEGEKDTPALAAYLAQNLKDKRLGMDGRCVTLREATAYGEGARVVDIDLVSDLWPDRPPRSQAPAFVLDAACTGRSAKDKIKALRGHMAEKKARATLLTDLMDGAWLFNLRGGDMPHTPVARAFAVVEQDTCRLFMAANTAGPVSAYLEELGAEVLPYDAIYSFLSRYGEGDGLLVSPPTLSLSLAMAAKAQGASLLADDYLAMARCAKNIRELICIREAHVLDGVVMVRFLRYLKAHANRLDEYAAGTHLDAMRRGAGCVDTSFDTICGYGPNAAVVHYHAPAEGSLPLQREGLLLVDSGGQWNGATTDVTRTVALGPVTEEEKTHFTLVLRGMLALMDARFPKGVDGARLDALARQPIWRAGLNYGHGTGHGVGAMLCVHEPPVRIRYDGPSTPFRPGMVVSDEPGLYFPGSHGIRLENLLECVECENGMLGFAPLTLVPIDLDAVDHTILESEDVRRLNAYHALVWDTLSPLLDGEDRTFLGQATRPLSLKNANTNED
ncbi:MAG: aminopeptidase P family protein [Candidatus Pelethousia sp.]|nr:aminopeptidase P family protein [Candidatus Pelethousia sp.]